MLFHAVKANGEEDASMPYKNPWLQSVRTINDLSSHFLRFNVSPISWAAFVLNEDRAASKSSLLLLGTIPLTPFVAMIRVSTATTVPIRIRDL